MHFAKSSDVVHEVQIFGLSNVDFSLPAEKITTLTEEYRFREWRNIMQLMSHAHEHMLELRVEITGGARHGELVYVSYDWEHPLILELDPPLVLERGEGFKVEATYDN